MSQNLYKCIYLEKKIQTKDRIVFNIEQLFLSGVY